MTKLLNYVGGVLVAVALLLTINNAQPVAAQDTLYDRLGGEPAVQAVVDEFLANVAADDRINSYFADTDMERLNQLLVEQICDVSGGPCTYSGRGMREAHAGLGLTEADFTALVEDLVAALNTFNVPEEDQAELLTIFGGMESEIVEESSTDSEVTDAASVDSEAMDDSATQEETPAQLPQSGGETPGASSYIWLLLIFGVGLLAGGAILRQKSRA